MNSDRNPVPEGTQVFASDGTLIGPAELRDNQLVANNRVIDSDMIDRIDQRGVHLRFDAAPDQRADDELPIDDQREVRDRLIRPDNGRYAD